MFNKADKPNQTIEASKVVANYFSLLLAWPLIGVNANFA